MADSSVPVNFYAGAPLNRLSWLRESSLFLNTAVEHPNAKWVVLKAGRPLTRKSAEKQSLAYLPTSQLAPLLGIGKDRAFGQKEHPTDAPVSAEGEEPKSLVAARLRGPTVVFLGVKEREGAQALPVKGFKSAEDLPGDPYFGLDVSRIPDEELAGVISKAEGLDFIEARAAGSFMSFDFDAPVFALARSMLDWNGRNRFCAGCGSPVHSIWGGWKLCCSSLLPWVDNTGKERCITAEGLHNFQHPRTDAVVIMAVLDDKGDRILMGHNKRFPTGFYSTLAGFIEPSERFEDAVKREIYEESGVKVHSVQYHSGQPWPYPANLMVGFYAFADASQTIRLDLDTELSDVRWFTREEVLKVLEHPLGTPNNGRELKHLTDEDIAKFGEPPFKVPAASQAIAGILIAEWAHGRVKGLSPDPKEVSKI